jgi:hypothetical protein
MLRSWRPGCLLWQLACLHRAAPCHRCALLRMPQPRPAPHIATRNSRCFHRATPGALGSGGDRKPHIHGPEARLLRCALPASTGPTAPEEPAMNIKLPQYCAGCGIRLQQEDPDQPGWVEAALLCLSIPDEKSFYSKRTQTSRGG